MPHKVSVFVKNSGESRLEIEDEGETVRVYLPPAATEAIAEGETDWKGGGLSLQISPPPKEGDFWCGQFYTNKICVVVESRKDISRLFAQALAEMRADVW